MRKIKQKQNCEKIKVQEYMTKYIKELQRHFDMSDKEMRVILYKVYKDLSPFAFLKLFVKNQFSMLKSFYSKLKGNNHGN